MHIAHKNMVLMIIKPYMSSESCLSEDCNQRTTVVLFYSQLFQAVKGLANPPVLITTVASQADSNGLRMH